MKLSEIIKTLEADLISTVDDFETDIESFCASDLMSDVLASVCFVGAKNAPPETITLADEPPIHTVRRLHRIGFNRFPVIDPKTKNLIGTIKKGGKRMKLRQIVEKLGLEVKTADEKLDTDVAGGYTSDLLSDVLANSRENDLWITLQIHPNIVAIACMKQLAGIVIINNKDPQEETLNLAREKGVPIMVSSMTAYQLSGRLHALGLSGNQNDAQEN